MDTKLKIWQKHDKTQKSETRTKVRSEKKNGSLYFVMALLLVYISAVASVTLAIQYQDVRGDDFYESSSFADYYNRSIWLVTKLAVMTLEEKNGDTTLAPDIAMYVGELDDQERIFYSVRDLQSGEVIVQSSRYETYKKDALITSHYESDTFSAAYHSVNGTEILPSVKLYDEAREMLKDSSLTMDIGVVAYTAHSFNDELHDKYVSYDFYHTILTGLPYLVGIGVLAVLLGFSLLGYAVRRLDEDSALIGYCPSDVGVIVAAGAGLVMVILALDKFELDTLVRGIAYDSTMQIVFLGLQFILGYVFVALCTLLLRRILNRTLFRRSLIAYVLMGIGQAFGSLSRVIWGRGAFRKRILSFVIITAVVIALNILFALGDPSLLIFLIPIDFLIAFWTFRFVVSLSEIVEKVIYESSGGYDLNFDTQKTMPLLIPFAQKLDRMQEAVDVAVQKAVNGERLKTELLTNVSHDLKTPLTSVINYVKLLMQSDLPDEKTKSYVWVIDEKTQRLKSLVDDILEMSKLSSGNINLKLVEVDLHQMMIQALAEFDTAYRELGLTIIQKGTEQPIKISADADKLWRVLENVLGNIEKYVLPQSRIYIVTAVQKNFVQLEIKNISARPLMEDGQYFTERFARGDLSRQSEGSGLGLAIARELVERMKGHFEVQTDGDLFKVTMVFEKIIEA